MALSQPRPNPMKGRVVSDGDTQASLGNVANIITVVRILLAPVFIWLLLADAGEMGVLRWVAAALFVVAIVTDSVDGFLARRQNLVTDFGKLVDPIADKILIGGALIALSILGELWWWVTAVILIRELGITVYRFIALRERVIAASIWGKVKTVLQAVALSVWLVPFPVILGEWFWGVNYTLMGLALALTVISGVEYLYQAYRVSKAAHEPVAPTEE